MPDRLGPPVSGGEGKRRGRGAGLASARVRVGELGPAFDRFTGRFDWFEFKSKFKIACATGIPAGYTGLPAGLTGLPPD